MTARPLDPNILQATTALPQQHYPALDGLRGAAAYLVVFAHYANYSGLWSDIFERGTGQVGVMLFFALSGFLMGAIYLQREASNAQIMQFYGKRVARVFPLYLFLVGLSFLFSMAATDHIFYAVDGSNIARHLMFLQGEHVLWTIPVEVQFYLLFPLLWLGASHLKDQRWLFALVPIAVGLGFFLDDFGRSILGHFHYFILGIAASLVVRYAIPYANALFVVSLVALGLYLPGTPLVIQYEDTNELWQDPFYMVLIPVLVASAAQSSIAAKALGCRPMAFIGKISYSVYLTHIPIIVAIQSYTNFGYESKKGFVIFMILLVGISYLSYRLIEAPSRNWLSRRLRPRPT